MEHINIEIKGKFNKYAQLKAEHGWCFYNINDEEFYYLTELFTPVVDEEELAKTFVVVQGNADELNEELDKKREEQVSDE